MRNRHLARLAGAAAVASVVLQCMVGAAMAGGDLEPRYDLLIRKVTIVDVVSRRFIPDQDILVSGKLIRRVGSTGAGHSARRTIDGSGLIAMPGFVDTHTHLWQHIARGAASGAQLQDWARKVYRLAHHATAAEVRDVVSAAAGDALLNGITTVADFTSDNFGDWVHEATLQGMRDNNIDGAMVWWRPAVFLPWQLQDRQIANLKEKAGEGIRIWAGIGPMSFLSLPAVYDGARAAARNGMSITEHSMENLGEARSFSSSLKKYIEKFGARLADGDRMLIQSALGDGLSDVDLMASLSRTADQLRQDPLYREKLSKLEIQSLGAIADFAPPSPIPVLASWGVLDGFLAIHGVWPASRDIATFSKHGVSVSFNPESNMYLASGVAPVQSYQAHGIRVTLGTDGAASNDRISMFDAMRAASMAQRVHALSPEATAQLDDWFWIKAATIEGAAALGLAERTGSIEQGKEADLVLLDRSRLGLSPFVESDEGAAA